MSVYVVPQIAWGNVLDAFSRLHRGWLTCVRAGDPDAASAQPESWRALASVAVTSPPDTPAIRIDFTDGASVNVKEPIALRLEARDDGAERALEIDRAAGEFVRLVFRATARPEDLDGTAHCARGGSFDVPSPRRS